MKKIKAIIQMLKEDGIKRFFVFVVDRYGLPIKLNSIFRWEAGKNSQIRFWDQWFSTKGLRWPEEYRRRLDPDLVLQTRPKALLPERSEVDILDVGAGPLTVLGKKDGERKINITAVDPLADEYNKIMEKYNVFPIVRTQKGDAEKLSENFQPNTFNLVYASNAIDHCYDPEKAILEMIKVVKPNCYVLLEHRENEAKNQNYSGFHQWNFSLTNEGQFIISSKNKEVNMTQKYAEICTITSEMDEKTIINRIRKTISS